MLFSRFLLLILIVVCSTTIPSIAFAQDTADVVSEIDTGDTAWILISTGLVLFMTLPALALFYGGLVHRKNVLSILMQCLIITSVMSLIWVTFGYSLAFDSTGMVKGEVGISSFIGGTSHLMLNGITPDSVNGTIPSILFVAFQMTFAAITPASVVGCGLPSDLSYDLGW